MRKLPDDEALINIVFADYKKCAKRREYTFDVERDLFAKLIFSDCFYCGRPPSNQIAGRNGSRFRKHNGLDRIDNHVDYNATNVVPCCRWCNEAKRAKPFDDYVAWLEGLSKNLEKIRGYSIYYRTQTKQD